MATVYSQIQIWFYMTEMWHVQMWCANSVFECMMNSRIGHTGFIIITMMKKDLSPGSKATGIFLGSIVLFSLDDVSLFSLLKIMLVLSFYDVLISFTCKNRINKAE